MQAYCRLLSLHRTRSQRPTPPFGYYGYTCNGTLLYDDSINDLLKESLKGKTKGKGELEGKGNARAWGKGQAKRASKGKVT